MNIKPKVKTEHIMIHVAPETKVLVVTIATERGLSVSSLLNSWLIEALKRKNGSKKLKTPRLTAVNKPVR